MHSRRRTAVTGLGVVSSIGVGVEAFWASLLEGRSGIHSVERFDTSEYDTHIGGEVRNFMADEFVSPRDAKKLGRGALFAIGACELSLRDSGIHPWHDGDERAALCLGTTMADIQALEEIDDVLCGVSVSRATYLRKRMRQYPSCMLAIEVARRLRMAGPVTMIPTACAAGNYAIAYGHDLIRSNKADIVLAGGVDPFSRIAFTGFNRLLALAPDVCRPFDRNRKGTVVGEGAGMIVMESLERAELRGARIYAEIAGYGTSCDASHMTIPSLEGVREVMFRALKDAGVSATEVSYISAHGTGTPANDRTECAAVVDVFGERAGAIPISSIKSMLGHTMGAASAIEAIACALAVSTDTVPPTINYQTPDPECPIDCVPNVSRRTRVDVALNNSFAFGGNNACVVFRKYTGSK